MVIFHTWHLQKNIILISSHFANEPWEPWNTLPNSHRSDLKQKIQKSLNSKIPYYVIVLENLSFFSPYILQKLK